VEEIENARIRVFRNDPEGRGDRLVLSEPPSATETGPWGFRVEGRAPEPRPYPPDTPEFLYWQLASALERGKRLWSERLPLPGRWIPGAVLPAVPVAGVDLNAYYDRRALRFFRDVDAKTGAVIQAGDSPDVAAHEQGHAVLDALRPDLWDAPHFEIAAFHEAFGDMASILVALAEPALAREALRQTRGDPSASNLVSRLAEELGEAVRDRYGSAAALPGALRDAVNAFRYQSPAALPDSAPASALSAEPHSFCRVMTGAFWDVLVAIFRRRDRGDLVERLRDAAGVAGRLALAAAASSPSGSGFFGTVSSRLVREARGEADPATAAAVADALLRRGLPADATDTGRLHPDRDESVPVPPDEEEPPTPALVRAIAKRLGPDSGGPILTRTGLAPDPGGAFRVLRGRRPRDLFLSGPEYGPADGAAVEISDGFELGFGKAGYLEASRVHRAAGPEEADARAFVRFLARRRRIAPESARPPAAETLAREGKTHAVVRDEDGVRRLRRVWIASQPVRREREEGP
jgi:hypothetical protein